MATTLYFKEKDQQRADFIQKQCGYSSRTEAVREALKQMEKQIKEQLLQEKYSQEKSVPHEFELTSAEAFESLEDY